ncbi:hypothetical protein [Bathymodiolus thermophilus thioautotrophic gill symbiont]|nr:hypothetical protein [Bathymodiolus thermophilus thioautotrophic gill symbiont]
METVQKRVKNERFIVDIDDFLMKAGFYMFFDFEKSKIEGFGF